MRTRFLYIKGIERNAYETYLVQACEDYSREKPSTEENNKHFIITEDTDKYLLIKELHRHCSCGRCTYQSEEVGVVKIPLRYVEEFSKGVQEAVRHLFENPANKEKLISVEKK